MTAHLRVSEEVVESAVGVDVILLHLGTGQYYALDATAVLIWNCIKAGTALDAIPALMAREFDAEADQIRQDVENFLSELFEHGILLKM